MKFTRGLLALLAAALIGPSSFGVGLVTQSGPRCFGCAVVGGGDTALAQAAATLSANQSLLFGTVPSGIIASDGAPNTAYGSSGVYDPIGKQVKYLGKRNSIFQYRLLVYDEAINAWSLDSNLPPGTGSAQNGHGYDHNALDPSTGDHYFRPYNDTNVYKWTSGTWSSLPVLANEDDAASLAWFPGVGLIYADCRLIRKFAGGSWTDIATGLAASQNHTIAEYNATANVLIFGAGNCNETTLRKMTSGEVITTIASAPFEVGSSELQGLLASVPNEDTYLGWKKTSTSWSLYDVSADNWSPVTQSTGNGATPQTGTPNIDGFFHCIGIPIDDYDVIMYVCGSGTGAGEVWIYKH